MSQTTVENLVKKNILNATVEILVGSTIEVRSEQNLMCFNAPQAKH